MINSTFVFLRRSKNTPKQLEVPIYPNLLCNFWNVASFKQKSGYFGTTNCSGLSLSKASVSCKICSRAFFSVAEQLYPVTTKKIGNEGLISGEQLLTIFFSLGLTNEHTWCKSVSSIPWKQKYPQVPSNQKGLSP